MPVGLIDLRVPFQCSISRYAAGRGVRAERIAGGARTARAAGGTEEHAARRSGGSGGVCADQRTSVYCAAPGALGTASDPADARAGLSLMTACGRAGGSGAPAATSSKRKRPPLAPRRGGREAVHGAEGRETQRGHWSRRGTRCRPRQPGIVGRSITTVGGASPNAACGAPRPRSGGATPHQASRHRPRFHHKRGARPPRLRGDGGITRVGAQGL
jgi:hypothetical protein